MSFERQSVCEKVKSFFDKEGFEFKCKIVNCNSKLLKGGIGNLKKHLIAKHRSSACGIGLLTEHSSTTKALPTQSTSVKITLMVNRNEIYRGAVKFIAGKCISFRALEDEGFKQMTGAFFRAADISLNRFIIKEKMNYAANEINRIIDKSLDGKLFCLKMDIAERMSKSILGINIQYLDGTKITIRTIGVIELDCIHTSQNLTTKILQLFANRNLKIENVYCSTTDNGANMIKASELFAKAQKDAILNIPERPNYEQHEAEAESDSDDQDEDFELQSDEEIDDDMDDDDMNGDDPEELSKELRDLEYELSTQICVTVRCVCHTLQLAVYDVMKNYKSYFNVIRRFVKNLRKSTHNDLFNHAAINKPPKDVCTRWSSTYNMIKCIVEHQEFYRGLSVKTLKLKDKYWEFMVEYVKAFEPISVATKIFQEKQLFIKVTCK